MTLLKIFENGSLAKRNRNGASSSGGDANDVRIVRPRYRIEETDTEFVAQVDMPGVARKGLEVSLAEGVLEVSGTRTWPAEEDWKPLSGHHDTSLRYRLRVAVGDEVDGEAITAKLEDGALRLTLPKAEEKRPRKIAVN